MADAVRPGPETAFGSKKMKIEINRLSNDDMARQCARFTAESEPWLTLGISFDRVVAVLGNPDSESYVASVDGAPAGVIVIQMKGAFPGYVKLVSVSAEFRGRGIGGRMMTFAEKRIFAESPNVFICVSSFNRDAQKFYEKLGYEKAGLLKEYVVSGHDEILLRKSTGPLQDFRKSGNG